MCYAVSRSLNPIMRNVTYFLRIWCVGVQKEDRVYIGHADKDTVKGHNGMQQGKHNDTLQAKNNEVFF